MKKIINFKITLVLVVIILSVLTSLFININTTFFLLVFYISGLTILKITNNSLISNEFKIYNILFFAGFTYILVSYVYMQFNNYNYLLILDTADSFYPNTIDYLSYGNIFKSFNAIWNDYNLFNRSNAGYYSILTIFGYISKLIGSELYTSLQIGTLFLTSFIGLLLYKISVNINIDKSNSFKNTLYICLCSYLFFYYTLILRDSIILLLFLLISYIFFTKKKTLNIILIFLLSSCIMFLRLESGLFAFLFIPLYIVYIFKQASKNLKIFYIFSSFLVFYVLYVILRNNFEILFFAYENNQNNYIVGVGSGSGIIASLQNRPPIIGDILSVIYTSIQPIPFWSKLYTSKAYSIPECYNIMAFPTAVAGFFNFASVFYIVRAIIIKHININLAHKFLLSISLLFLFLQSAVVSQRRVLFGYVILYLMASLSYVYTNKKNRFQFNTFIVFSYILLNLFGVYLLW